MEVPGKIRFDEVVATPPGPGEVRIRVRQIGICGSDIHVWHGTHPFTPYPVIQGHEFMGVVEEVGSGVTRLRPGDRVVVPFNIACGRCRNCREGQTGICLNVNPARAGSAYGYVDMGGWLGGQADYVMVPFADFNLLKFPDRDAALAVDVPAGLVGADLPPVELRGDQPLGGDPPRPDGDQEIIDQDLGRLGLTAARGGGQVGHAAGGLAAVDGRLVGRGIGHGPIVGARFRHGGGATGLAWVHSSTGSCT